MNNFEKIEHFVSELVWSKFDVISKSFSKPEVNPSIRIYELLNDAEITDEVLQKVKAELELLGVSDADHDAIDEFCNDFQEQLSSLEDMEDV